VAGKLRKENALDPCKKRKTKRKTRAPTTPEHASVGGGTVRCIWESLKHGRRGKGGCPNRDTQEAVSLTPAKGRKYENVRGKGRVGEKKKKKKRGKMQGGGKKRTEYSLTQEGLDGSEIKKLEKRDW